MTTRAELRRWSEEVARDPDSLAFLPLADAYRRQGRRKAAIKLCLRGLSRHPQHVDAHGLLARLYLETGDRRKAADEWSIMLRLEADNFEANRGIGFYHLERGEHGAAHRHLRRAAAARPDDPTVREALELAASRSAAAGGPAGSGDPGRVFDPLTGDRPFRGAVLFDGSGLALAATFDDDAAATEELGAMLAEAVGEAVRATDLLELGDWNGMMMETDENTLHAAPLDEEHVVLFVAAPDSPAGWVLRTAERARRLAARFLEHSR